MEENIEEIKKLIKYRFEKYGIIYISQYLLNNVLIMNEIEEIGLTGIRPIGLTKKIENNTIEENEIFLEDEEIIELIYEALDENIPEKLEKINEESYKEERVKLFYAIPAFLKIDYVKNNENWSNIFNKCIEVLQHINPRDFITILDTIDSKKIYEEPWMRDIIKNKIGDMTEFEFLRLQEIFYNEDVKTQEFCEEEISKKIEEASEALCTRHIGLSNNSDDIEKLLGRIKQRDSVEAILYIILNGLKDKNKEKVIELINGLSNRQVVRLTINLLNITYDKQDIDEVLQKKVEVLPKDMVRYIFFAINNANPNWKNFIVYIAEKNELAEVKSNGAVYSNEPFFEQQKSRERIFQENRYTMYLENALKVKNASMTHIKINGADILKMAEESDTWDIERRIEQTVEERYDTMQKYIDVGEEKADFLIYLDGLSDRDFLKAVNVLKNKMKDVDFEKNYADALFTISNLSFLELSRYINYRILEMNNISDVTLASMLLNTESTLFNPAFLAKFYECEEEITKKFDDERE